MALTLLTLAAAFADPPLPPPTRAAGAVRFDLAQARIDGRICLTGRSGAFARNFSLNAGLNVRSVTDGAGKPIDFEGWYNPAIDGEARVYSIATAAETLCVEYLGAFPRYPARDAPDDFKGVVAFNGDSIRASEQAAWLPTPYDPDRKVRGDFAYEIDVSCHGCRFVYMNGGRPATRSRATFASRIARPALFFGGTGPITHGASVTILNEKVPGGEVATLSRLAERIGGYYGNYLAKPLGERPTLLRMTTINQATLDKVGRGWGFASWPTIAFSGSVRPIANQIASGGAKAERSTSYMAHEIGHYYFGTVVSGSGPYRWLLVESMAEFLALKAVGTLLGGEAQARHVRRLEQAVAHDKRAFHSLDAITDEGQIGHTYRYSYAPLLLKALETRVGEVAMRGFVRRLLATPSIENWADLTAVALAGGIAKPDWDRWQRECVSGGTRACAAVPPG